VVFLRRRSGACVSMVPSLKREKQSKNEERKRLYTGSLGVKGGGVAFD